MKTLVVCEIDLFTLYVNDILWLKIITLLCEQEVRSTEVACPAFTTNVFDLNSD